MANKLFSANNKLSRNARLALLIIGVILIILNLFMVNYEQLWSRENLGAGLQILANFFIVAAMVASLRYTAKKSEE